MGYRYKLTDHQGNFLYTRDRKLCLRILSEQSNPFNNVLMQNEKSAMPIGERDIINTYDEFLDHFF